MNDNNENQEGLLGMVPPARGETEQRQLLVQLFFAHFYLGLSRTGIVGSQDVDDVIGPLFQEGAAALGNLTMGSPQVGLATSNAELFGSRVGVFAVQRGLAVADGSLVIAVRNWICPLFPFCR